MKTDIQAVREATFQLFSAFPITEAEGLEGLSLTQHPFVEAMFFFDRESQQLLTLDTPENLKKCVDFYSKKIYSSRPRTLYSLVRSAYKLLWFSFVQDYLSPEDFGELLCDSWTSQENPNQDINVPREQAIAYFRKAQPQFLMDDDDFQIFSQIPDSLTLYRGVSPGRERLGLSWTDDQDTALWFKKRFERSNRKGYVLQASVPKSNVLAYFDNRGEKEFVVDVFKIKVKRL